LDFLRCLVGPPIPASRRRRQCFNREKRQIRGHASAALRLRTVEEASSEEGYDIEDSTEPLLPSQIHGDGNRAAVKQPASVQEKSGDWGRESDSQSLPVQYTSEASPIRKVQNNDEGPIMKKISHKFDAPLVWKIPQVIEESNDFGSWKYHPWAPGQLEFESNLDEPSEVPRLLDQVQYKHNLKLWAFLLDYRKRIYGSKGVAMFWDVFRERRIRIPPEIPITNKLWSAFLDFGLEYQFVLGQIVEYTDQLWTPETKNEPKSITRRWKEIYSRIILHFLVHGRGADALHWHNLLSKHDRPGHGLFRIMCNQVAKSNGDLNALRIIYHQRIGHRFYSSIVPTLCNREDFKSALQWHFICMEHLDFPLKSEEVEPLLRFLCIYDFQNARLVTESLLKAQVSFASVLSLDVGQKPKLSREFTNMIHGEILNVREKSYNDALGARWFATTWVSLDIAINAIHALGMREIGPLSLQAIALREPDPISISNRISQLEGLGISIGNSMFSKAIDKFSRNREYENLEGLLASDQHPDELEDRRLQENLLLSYVRAKDWAQYRRTLAIQILRGRYPIVEKQNLMLRVHAARRDTAAVMQILSGMHRDGIVVKINTVSAALRSILRPRQPSKRPMAVTRTPDLKLAVYVLKSIMNAGSYVPPSLWREIIRRLGMLGHSQGLEKISVFLASWYNGDGTSKSYYCRVPKQVRASHPLHPLKILFPANVQKAIVEWGFIHAFKRRRLPWLSTGPHPVPEVTSGIALLKKLHRRGVQINAGVVKTAVLNRLVAYYGPGVPNKLHNREARIMLGFQNREEAIQSLDQMAKQIDGVLGGQFLTGVNLLKIIESMGRTRRNRLHRRSQPRL
jgi:hypothetical protein